MDAKMPRAAATRQPRSGDAWRVLAVDTCFARCAVALAERRDAVAVVASHAQAMTRGHAATLTPMVDDALRQAGWRPADLDLIAVTIGPGSFTGVRIGIAMARGLAMTLRCPVAGVLTTDALLRGAKSADHAHTDGVIVVAIASGRGDYFLAVSDAPPFAGDARALAPLLKGRRAILVGDGARPLLTELHGLGVLAETGISSPAIDPAIVAVSALAKGVDYWATANIREGLPRPLYLRGADVTLADGARTTADLER